MSLFRKREFDRPATPAAKRAALLPTPDLVPWAETCLYEIGRSLNDYARTAEATSLAEASGAVEVLNAVMGEIKARSVEVADAPSAPVT